MPSILTGFMKEVIQISEGNEIAKAVFSTLADISSSEKRRALQRNDHGAAIVAGILEGLFREAAKSH